MGAAREVPVGQPWCFTEHRSQAEIIEAEIAEFGSSGFTRAQLIAGLTVSATKEDRKMAKFSVTVSETEERHYSAVTIDAADANAAREIAEQLRIEGDLDLHYEGVTNVDIAISEIPSA